MSLKIRRLIKEDFPQVSKLFDSRKTIEELEWLYYNLEDPSIFNAYVAVDDQNTIIGVDAFILSSYSYNNNQIIGVTPITWMVKSDYKGMAGISLFKKVLEHSNLSIIIGGSQTSLDLYPLFKYRAISKISMYYKILNLTAYYKSLKDKSVKKRIKMLLYLLPSRFKYAAKSNLTKDIEFIAYARNNYEEEKIVQNVFEKKLSKKCLDKFLDCPLLQSHAYLIRKNKQHLGFCVLYIDDIDGIKKGRIVHLPFYGTDHKLWNSTINYCVKLLKKAQCCVITIQAQHHLYRKACVDNGFINIKTHDTRIFLRDLEGSMKDVPDSSWNLQFSEGDHAYRTL